MAAARPDEATREAISKPERARSRTDGAPFCPVSEMEANPEADSRASPEAPAPSLLEATALGREEP